MTYATQQDLIDRFGQEEIQQLSDRENLGSINTAVVAKALADADAEINSYLVARYTLPLASAAVVLVKVASDIARYYLYDIGASDLVKARYDDGVKFLDKISKGTASLGLDSNNAPPAIAAGGVKIITNDRVFNAGKLADY